MLDIVIKDKGVGIPDIEQARRPAYTTGGAERSGMGFTIMESFMTDLEITSKPGKGTTVHMRRKLPAAAMSRTEELIARRRSRATGKRPKLWWRKTPA